MDLRQIFADRREFIGRLRFEDAHANVSQFNSPFSEQVALINALADPEVKSIVVLKPRQIGMTTANCADTFWATYTATKPLRTIVATDHSKTTRSIFKKFCDYYHYLPRNLQSANPFSMNKNDKTLISDRTGALIDHMTARGDTHGRGWTYQRIVAEELAYWQHPEDVWGGLRATQHKGPDSQTVIISTPNGPGDFYHDRVLAAQEAEQMGDKSVRFLFSRWSDHHTYRQTPPKGWEPDQEEWELGKTHGLDIEQLYWRHEMIHGIEGMGEMRFRREYPLTVEDGFLVLQGSWFDSDYLNEVLNVQDRRKEGERRIYIEPELTGTYVIGADPSWVNGGDYAVAVVLSDCGEVCAVLSMQFGGEDLFARELADLSAYYNKARVLCEANTGGAGRVVIRHLRREGIPTWREPQTGKDWTTTRGNKELAYSYARQLVNGDALDLSDHMLIQELMHVREVNGKIEGQDGYHDDHADALVLACWSLRSLPTFSGKPRYIRRDYSRRNPADRIREALI